MTSLHGSHVIITGGSEGIGYAVAHRAVARGAKVSLIARRESVLADAANRLGPNARWATADVRDGSALRQAVEQLAADQGPCDVLVANAGYGAPARFWELTEAEFGDQMETNYLGAVHATSAVLATMRERHAGHLCYVSSTAGLVGVYGFSAYSPTKFALRGFAEALRAEVRPDGIRVSVVYPPDTDTPGFVKENEHKPIETSAVSGTISPVPADKVATGIIKGIERNRFTICVDPMTAGLARFAGLGAPLIRAVMDRQVRRAQRT